MDAQIKMAPEVLVKAGTWDLGEYEIARMARRAANYTPENPTTKWNKRYQDFIFTIEIIGHNRVVLDIARLGEGDDTDREYLRRAVSLLWEAAQDLERKGPRIDRKRLNQFIEEAEKYLERTTI